MKAQATKLTYSTRLGLILALVVVALGVMVATVAWAQPGDPDLDPDPGTHSAPVTTTVSISYDEPISAATVTSRTFAVHGMQTGLVTSTHSVQDSTIVVTPIKRFHPGELVQATATTYTTSITGEHPLEPTVWQFRAAAGVGSGRFSHGNDFGPGADLTVALAVGDVDGDGDNEVVTLEGEYGAGRDGPATHVDVWRWNGFGFTLEYRSPPGTFRQLGLTDGNNDGILDIAVR